MQTLYYRRHFILLFGAAALAIAGPEGLPPGGLVSVEVSFAWYGALHATTLVAALRTPYSVRRKLLFIVIAASLSLLSVMLSAWMHRLGGAPSLGHGPWLLLGMTSGAGAASYAALVRRFWIPRLAARAIFSITSGCILATTAVLVSGAISKPFGLPGLAISWWFAFSASLWYQDGK